MFYFLAILNNEKLTHEERRGNVTLCIAPQDVKLYIGLGPGTVLNFTGLKYRLHYAKSSDTEISAKYFSVQLRQDMC